MNSTAWIKKEIRDVTRIMNLKGTTAAQHKELLSYKKRLERAIFGCPKALKNKDK